MYGTFILQVVKLEASKSLLNQDAFLHLSNKDFACTEFLKNSRIIYLKLAGKKCAILPKNWKVAVSYGSAAELEMRKCQSQEQSLEIMSLPRRPSEATSRCGAQQEEERFGLFIPTKQRSRKVHKTTDFSKPISQKLAKDWCDIE